MVVTVVAAVENAYFPLLFLPLFFVSHDTADSALDTGAQSISSVACSAPADGSSLV
jgi:hypothetical protein